MSSKQKTWFKSVFDIDSTSSTTIDSTNIGVPPPIDKHTGNVTNNQMPPTTQKRSRKRSQATLKTTVASQKVGPTSSGNATVNLSADDDVANEAEQSHVTIVVPPGSASWLDNFAPRNVDDLAIHVKKIEELQRWLAGCKVETAKKRSAPILCISGPAGSGKTATLRLLARLAGFDVQEWLQPVDVEQQRGGNFGDDNHDAPAFADSQTLLFEQFLHRASRYKSLFEDSSSLSGPRLVLVEDLPNVFLKDAEAFGAVLEHYVDYGKSPLVFIVTDSRSRQLNIGYTLFGDANRQKFGIDAIAFNACSSTLLKRGLKRIAAIMAQPAFSKYYEPVTADIVDSIVLTSQGDLRNAMINMHMAAQKSSRKLAVEVNKKSKSTKKSSGTKLTSMGCDETITTMHALGRVLNPKYSETRTDRLQHSPEQLADDFTSQPTNFVNLLFANYACHFRNIDDTLDAVDALSATDVLLSECWHDDVFAQLGLNVAIRGIMTANRNPATGWHPIRGQHKKRNTDVVVEELRRRFGIGLTVSAKTMAVDYRTFARAIGVSSDGSSEDVERGDASTTDTKEEEARMLAQSIEW